MAKKSFARGIQRILLVALLGAVTPLITDAVLAQQRYEATIEEVIVTAERRAIALEDTPMSILVFSESQILDQGITEFTDYVFKIPGISREDEGVIPVFGGGAFHLRGLSSDGTTSLYLDELALGGSYQPRLHDVARVEVLRGPQGTLFGEGTMGGALRIITNQPDLGEFSGRVHGEIGTISQGEENYMAEAVVNIPIVDDKLAVRISAYRELRGGWVDAFPFEFKDLIVNGETPIQSELGARRDANSADMVGGRISVRWQPTENLTLTAYSLFQSANMDNDPGVALELRDQETYAQFRFFDYDVSQDFAAHNLTLQWDLGFADFLSSSSISDQQFNEFGDVTFFIRNLASLFGLPQPERGLIQYDIPRNIFAQEMRLVSKEDKRWSWIVGAFYIDSEADFGLGLFADPEPLPGFGVFLDTLAIGNVKQSSLFGELGFRIVDGLKLTLGARYANLKQKSIDKDLGLLGSGGTVETTSKSDEVLGKVWLTYDLNDDTMFYGGWSQGFRQGFGTTPIPVTCEDELEARIGVRQAGTQVNPDFVDNYEIGWKQRFGGGRATISASAYRMDWTDIISNIDLECGFDPAVNLGQARVDGLELELTVAITDQLTAGVNAALTDAEITDTIDPSQLGKSTPLVPKQHYNLFAHYRFPVMGRYEGYISADYQYMSKRLLERPIEYLPVYRMLNARIGVYWGDWEFKVFGKNLTNEYLLTGEPLQIPGELRLSSAVPRQIGVAVTRSF